MSVKNFVPTVWAVGFEEDLAKHLVFADDCNTSFEGSVTKRGEAVKLTGVGKPHIHSELKSTRDGVIEGPEAIEDQSAIMYINQIRYYNFKVDDIDKAQAKPELMSKYREGAAQGMADEMDAYIAALALDGSVEKLYGSSPVKVVTSDTPAAGEENVLEIMDYAIQRLQENNVPDSTPVVITVSPRFYRRLKKAYRELDTDNSATLKNGKVGMYGRVTVKVSNNVCKTESGAVDNIMIRTKDAIAFANPLTHAEAFRPENGFSDACKGFCLFDAKVVRPREVFTINVKYA